MTRYWWETCRGDHELFTSQIVLDEAGAGDPQSAQARLDLLEPLPLLEISPPVLLFAQNIIKSGLLPVEADRGCSKEAAAIWTRSFRSLKCQSWKGAVGGINRGDRLQSDRGHGLHIDLEYLILKHGLPIHCNTL